MQSPWSDFDLDILVNGRFLNRQPTGVDRFAIELLRAVDDFYANGDIVVAGFTIEVLVPVGVSIEHGLRHIPVRQVGRFQGQAWEQIDLPLAAGDGLLVNLCNTAPIFRNNQLVVIHDAATSRAPSSYSTAFRLWYGLLIPAIYRRSTAVCTVSKFSKHDLASLYGAREDVVVLPEGTDHMDRIKPDVGVLAKVGLTHRPYVLAVSSLAPHKNFATVVCAVEQMGDSGFDVVIAGGQNPAVFASAGSSLSSAVKYAGYVTDAELKALYQHASCFIFPSIYEGYGLPPTEAMACGCAVIASSAAAIPETCGDAALYFNPVSPASLADQLRRLMTDVDLRNSLCERGYARASTLRWRNTALALLNEIKRVSS